MSSASYQNSQLRKTTHKRAQAGSRIDRSLAQRGLRGAKPTRSSADAAGYQIKRGIRMTTRSTVMRRGLPCKGSARRGSDDRDPEPRRTGARSRLPAPL